MKTFLACIFLLPLALTAQQNKVSVVDDYWKLNLDKSITWDLTQTPHLPHKENIEMSGKKVSAIIYYELSENKELSIHRDVIFPQLRTLNKAGEPN